MPATDDERKRFAGNVKRLMRDRDLSQSDVARRAGIGRDNVSGYVRGKTVPNSRHLSRLAAALGVSAEELLRDKNQPKAPADDGILKMVQLPNQAGLAYIDVRRVVSTAQALQIFAILAEATG